MTNKTLDERWEQYTKSWKDREKVQPCLADQVYKETIMRQGLPPGTCIPLAISCPCPKCSPGSLGG